ncbi:MAG: ATP-dependent protease ATPase subunit HslU [Deltaproteobacteria bacterium]|nr:ATP-dependent protease ATPase subunit HslU [Deltaproteobacteria bacterium]
MSAALTPAEVVVELDRHIVGQTKAKRAVAVALRNRWRRRQVDPALADDIAPRNILLIGPTGVGKTEIARRLAKLAGAPFVKVEASKFTEVGYVGRDVESIVRDLVEVAIGMVEAEARQANEARARAQADEKILDLLLGKRPATELAEIDERRAKVRRLLEDGHLDEREVEVELQASPTPPMAQIFAGSGMEEIGAQIERQLGALMPRKTERKKMTIAEARRRFEAEAAEGLVDRDKVVAEALDRAQNDGIVFLDEIDKVAGGGRGHGPDVSREGVQRDLLPIVEGSTVQTKHGAVRTDHVLFIAAGAFHVSAVSDLIPELQGRFPVRVELDSLGAADFERILHEPESSLLRQAEALLATEGVTLRFSDAAVGEIAKVAADVNARQENIGARRLHTVLERLLEPLSFDAPTRGGETVEIDATMVRQGLGDVLEDPQLEAYIL